MSAAGAAVWGLVAVLALEGLDLAGAYRRTRGLPWRATGEPGPGPYALSTVVRLTAACGTATGLAAAGLVTTATGAFAVGVAVPLLLGRLVVTFGPLPAAEPSPSASPSPSSDPVPDLPPADPPVVKPRNGANGRLPRLRVRLPMARRKSDDDRET
jgi:hypothetical protein